LFKTLNYYHILGAISDNVRVYAMFLTASLLFNSRKGQKYGWSVAEPHKRCYVMFCKFFIVLFKISFAASISSLVVLR